MTIEYKQIEKYLDHTRNCGKGVMGDGGYTCTCGLDELKQKYAKPKT